MPQDEVWVFIILKVMGWNVLPLARVWHPHWIQMHWLVRRISSWNWVETVLVQHTFWFLILWTLICVWVPKAKGWFSLWGPVVVTQFWNSLVQNTCSIQWILGIFGYQWGFEGLSNQRHSSIWLGPSWFYYFQWWLQGNRFLSSEIHIFQVWGIDHSFLVCPVLDE